jgi:Zn-dependent protease with chaperone function
MPATLLVNNSVVDMLSAEDLDAALAHEYAHVVLRHGRMSRAGTWVPFVLMLLVMLLAGVMPQHRGQPASAFEVASVALIWFCVNSAVLALMRLRHEVEADEYASQVVGRDAMARVLVRVMGTQLLSAGLLSRLNVRVRVRRLEDAP